jgi:hypothetical protein
MFSRDNSLALPDTPEFSQGMEQALIAAARGRSSHRPWLAARLRKPAIAWVAAAAVAIGTGTGIDHALSDGSVSNSPGSSRGTAGAGARPVRIHLASFSVDRAANGTVTVTMFSNRTPEAAALRKALATAGVPALVTVGTVCYVPGPVSGLGRAISQSPHAPFGTAIITVTPSAIPSGSELSIGYFFLPGGNGGGIHVTMVPAHGPLTCKAEPPFGPQPG